MKRYIVKIGVIIFGTILISACSTSLENSDSPAVINPGSYRMEALQIEVGKKQVSTYIGEGPTYAYRTVHFFKDGRLTIQMHSDIPDENGAAKARYTVSGKKLIVTVKESTTPIYPEGSQ